MTASPDVKEAVERLEKLASISKFVVTTVKTADLHTILAELSRLSRLVGEAGEDKARLDFLDACNARLNSHYGTNYGWKLILNHNISRLMSTDWPMSIDLNDAQGGHAKLPSCRAAIDEARAAQAHKAIKSQTPGDGDE